MALEEYTDRLLREKMKKWIVAEGKKIDIVEPIDFFIPAFRSLSPFLRAEPPDVMSEVKDLKKRVLELERRVGKKRRFTEADYVYALFREDLEEKHFGRIVAIDTESKKIVGIGDTILEAYNQAKEKTGKDQFDFKKVGHKYIHKV